MGNVTGIYPHSTSQLLHFNAFKMGPHDDIRCVTRVPCNIPAGIWCKNDVVLTSMRRDDVASTSIQRHFDTKCPLGYVTV